jgi:surface antigen
MQSAKVRSGIVTCIALLGIACGTPALADRDHDDKHGDKHGHKHGHEHGHERHGQHQHGHKEVYWDGNCKVERKWEKDGDFKEKRKCKADYRPAPRPVAVKPAPVVVYPPWVVVEQGRPQRYRVGYEPAPVARGPVRRCNSETFGQVIGGVAGAVLGHQIGKSHGRVAVGTVGGAVAGVLVGGHVGRRMDGNNQACVGQALEVAPTGHRVEWADGGQQYVVVPGAPVNRNGTYCRPYEAQVRTENGWESIRGTACRREDGAWRTG